VYRCHADDGVLPKHVGVDKNTVLLCIWYVPFWFYEWTG